jgi:hypothetical protein
MLCRAVDIVVDGGRDPPGFTGLGLAVPAINIVMVAVLWRTWRRQESRAAGSRSQGE